jgi:hypothetical protein
MVGVVLLAKQELSGNMPSFYLLALLILIGAIAYAISLVLGDVLGLWRGYIGGAVRSLVGAFQKRRSMQTEEAT